MSHLSSTSHNAGREEGSSTSSLSPSPSSAVTTPSSSSPSPPSAARQYAAAVAAASTPPTLRPKPPVPAKREPFADLKWMWSRNLTPPATLTRDQIESTVLHSERVQKAIDKLIAESQNGNAAAKGSGGGHGGGSGSAPPLGGWSRESAQHSARAIFSSMYSEVNLTTIRSTIYTLRKCWRSMYEGIRVNQEGIDMLHGLAASKQPVVLLPMHKSHVDYLLLSYVCAAYHLFPPHIVAGDNLNMPVVGSILRNGGGLFIRRAWGGDELYKAVFFEYISLLLQHGFWIECFIEGTRSRMGKIKRPKTGFLSVLGDLLASGRLGDRDIALVPISISYDKVIEGSTYVNEMLGAPKRPESLTGTINSLNQVIRLSLGSIDVSICPPVSMREALGLKGANTSVALSREASLTRSAEQKRLILSLAHRLCYDMNQQLVISATSIVATVLLTHLHRGISRKDLIHRTDWVRHMIVERGGVVAPIFKTESRHAIVDRALKVLAKLVQEQRGIVFGFRGFTALELSFYRNQLLHLFIHEALVCVAMGSEYKDRRITAQPTTSSSSSSSSSAPSSPPALSARVLKSRLIDSVRFISQLLKFEFIYAPAPDLEANVDETIEALIQRGVFMRVEGPGEAGEGGKKGQTKGAAAAASSSSSSSSSEYLCLNPAGADTFLFLSMLIWPFIETYWVGLASLFVLLPDVVLPSSQLALVASRRAEALFYSGHVEFAECVNTESILNAYEWAISQGIVKVHQVGNQRMMQLTAEYQQHTAAEDEWENEVAAPSPPSSLFANTFNTAAAGTVTRRPTSLERLAQPPSLSAGISSSSSRKSLRSLVLAVGRFRKLRLMSSQASRTLLDKFVQELKETAQSANTSGMAGGSVTAGGPTTAATAAQQAASSAAAVAQAISDKIKAKL